MAIYSTKIMNNLIKVNVGPLTSFNSLVYYLSPKFAQIRESYLKGETPQIEFDFTNVQHKGISIAALTAFISASKKLSDFIGYPIPILANWEPKLQGFLSDIGFYSITEKFSIFKWQPENIIGGYISGNTSPNTKIIYYADTNPLKGDLNNEQIGLLKAHLKQKIAPNLLMRLSNLFYDFDETQEDIIINTTLELIVNSLTHAEDIAFVCIQRSSKRITISVCDSGLGFPKSLKKVFKFNNQLKTIEHEDGIFMGSLIQKNEHGLRLAINEVLNYQNNANENNGWVIISSYNSEIRWQKDNWHKALKYFDKINLDKEIPSIKIALGNEQKDFLEPQELEKGYWKKFDGFIVGTRITFEIVL